MGNEDNTNKIENVVPLPKEREIITILGEDNEVTGYISKTKKNILGRSWVALFQTGISEMAKMGLTGEQWSVWAYMVGTLDFDNYWRLPQKQIVDDLHMKKQNVSRAINALIAKDILIKGPKAGACNTYRLNPRILHRGSKNYKQSLIDYDYFKQKQKEQKEKKE